MQEFLHGAAMVILYLIPMALMALTARKLIKIPDELFRKILHFILLGAYIPLITAFKTWWIASGFALIFIIVLYPILTLLEKLPAFASFINQRRSGEIRNSMILALSMMALSTLMCWGVFGDRYLVLACVYAWGVGDAFAALIGKKFGRHKIKMKLADHKKSMEGSAAFLVTSTAAVWMVLMFRGGIGGFGCFIIALAGATVAMFVELCTKDGYDTFTCPAAAMAAILPLITLFEKMV